LTVHLALGASGVPPATEKSCAACVRDLTGNVVCAQPSGATAAATAAAAESPVAAAELIHTCCAETGTTDAARPPRPPVPANAETPAGSDDCAAGCQQCCAPAARAPATAVVVAVLKSPVPLAPAAPESPATTISPGPLGSIFHPPRA
jgi:hypothetical protein